MRMKVSDYIAKKLVEEGIPMYLWLPAVGLCI